MSPPKLKHIEEDHGLLVQMIHYRREPDVEQQMNVDLGLLDVFDNPIDDIIGIIDQLKRITGYGWHLSQLDGETMPRLTLGQGFGINTILVQ